MSVATGATVALVAMAAGFFGGLIAGLWGSVWRLRRNTQAMRDAHEHITNQRLQIEALQELLGDEPGQKAEHDENFSLGRDRGHFCK